MCYDKEPDLKDRDPYGINKHVKVLFHDVLAEPAGIHSCDCVWQGTDCCYNFMFSTCYGISVGLSHVCLSCAWGLFFGHDAFLHVWFLGPALRFVTLVVYIPAKCYSFCLRCVLDPWCEAFSYMFMLFIDQSDDPEMGLKAGRADDDVDRPYVWKPVNVMR